MANRPRIKYSSEQKKYMWDRWKEGDSLWEIGIFLGRLIRKRLKF